jgi:dTDP-4-dehydrorhamnose reductase
MMNGSKAAAKAVALEATLKKMIARPPDRMAAWLLFISTTLPFNGASSSVPGNGSFREH